MAIYTDSPHLKTHSVCFNRKKMSRRAKIPKTNSFSVFASYVCAEMHIAPDSRTLPVEASGWRIPVSLQIKHATFIFITGRWQLLSQDAELIRKPVLYTAGGNKYKEEKNAKIGSIISTRMDEYWRDTDRANREADDSLVKQKESIQSVRQVSAPITAIVLQCRWSRMFVSLSGQTAGGGERLQKGGKKLLKLFSVWVHIEC